MQCKGISTMEKIIIYESKGNKYRMLIKINDTYANIIHQVNGDMRGMQCNIPIDLIEQRIREEINMYTADRINLKLKN